MAEKVKPGFILSHEHVDMLLDEEPDVVKRVLQALYNFSMTGMLVIDGMTGRALKLLERMAEKVAEDEERFYSSKKSSAIGGSITQLRAKMKLAGTPISIEEARNMIRNGRADSNSLQATSSALQATSSNIIKENINKENINKENILSPSNEVEERAQVDEYFMRFWTEYPRKVDKNAARKAFDNIHPDETLLGQMLLSLKQQKKGKQWQDEKFIPYPANWLKDKRWEDETASTTTIFDNIGGIVL